MAGPAPAAMPAQLAPAGSVLSPGQQAALGATNKSFTGIAGTSGSGAGVLPLGTPAPVPGSSGGGLQGPPPLPSEDPVGSYANAYNSYLNQAKQQLNQSLVGSLQGIQNRTNQAAQVASRLNPESLQGAQQAYTDMGSPAGGLAGATGGQLTSGQAGQLGQASAADRAAIQGVTQAQQNAGPSMVEGLGAAQAVAQGAVQAQYLAGQQSIDQEQAQLASQAALQTQSEQFTASQTRAQDAFTEGNENFMNELQVFDASQASNDALSTVPQLAAMGITNGQIRQAQGGNFDSFSQQLTGIVTGSMEQSTRDAKLAGLANQWSALSPIQQQILQGLSQQPGSDFSMKDLNNIVDAQQGTESSQTGNQGDLQQASGFIGKNFGGGNKNPGYLTPGPVTNAYEWLWGNSGGRRINPF